MIRSERRERAAVIVALACLALLALWPVLTRSGDVLVADMTLLADQPWKPDWLGLDGGVPRAVPADAMVWLLAHLLPGGLAARAILVGILIGAGLGMAALVRTLRPQASLGAAMLGASLMMWNPFVFERLAIGHWGLLLGYAALPWAIRAALAWRSGEASAWSMILPGAVAAVGSPTGGLVVAAVTVVLSAGGAAPWRRWWLVVGGVIAVNLPWLVPGLLNPGVGDDSGASAFAARSDTPLGVWGSVATFGGIWKQAAVPEERDSLLLGLIALVALVASVGLLVVRRHWRLLGVGAVSLLVATLPGTALGQEAAQWCVAHVPGGGLLRDSQKWALAWVVIGTLGVALVADRIVVARARWVPVALGLVPVCLLPSFALGLSERLDPVTLPPDWSAVRALLADQPAAQRRTAVLPWSIYQAYPFTEGRAVLDPAIRYFPGQILTDTRLRVGATLVPGDDPARDSLNLSDPTALRAGLLERGVRFVLIERSGVGGAEVAAPRGEVLYAGADLELIDLGVPARLESGDGMAWVVLADLLACGVLAAALAVTGQRLWRGSQRRR